MASKNYVRPVEIFELASKMSYNCNTDYAIWQQIMGFRSCQASSKKKLASVPGDSVYWCLAVILLLLCIVALIVCTP